MLEKVLSWAFGSNPHHDHSRSRKPYESTVDQAREYAAELGPDLALAFDQLNHKTAMVLRAYVTAVCQEGHPYSEAERIRDAMKEYFEDTFGCWGSDWRYVPGHDEEVEGKDNEHGEWVGNPVFDKAFVNLMQELNSQAEKADGTRQAKRWTAVGYKDITKLTMYLQTPEIIKAEGAGRCLFFQAFAAIAFTLWLTFDEVLKLKCHHVRIQRSDPEGPLWLSITVPFRNSSPIDPSKANVYEIYPQLDDPHTCCVTKLLVFIRWIEMQQGRLLQPEDFLFPKLSHDDRIEPDQPFSVIQASNLLNKYASDAGLMDHRYNRLDTHCFRRGGAQYRLIHAQDPWSIKVVKWWGGWSEREPAEKILEYLSDDSQYEVSFGDMLSPHWNKTQELSGKARHALEVLTMHEKFESAIQLVESRHAAALTKIEMENQRMRRENMQLLQEIKRDNRETKQESKELRQEIAEMRNGISLLLGVSAPTTASRVPANIDPLLDNEQPDQPQEQEQQPQRRSERRQLPPKSPKEQLEQQGQALRSNPLEPRSHEQSQEPPSQPPDQHPKQKIPSITTWKEAVKQWDEGDPENGLMVPLHKWTQPMVKGCFATFYNRRAIAKEFLLFGRDEGRMQKVYGHHMSRVHELVDAIRWRHTMEKRQFGKHRVLAKAKGRQSQKRTAKSTDEEESEQKQEKEQEQEEWQPEEEEEGEDETLDQPINKPPPPIIPKISHWSEAITQWEEGDPENGLTVPLRDWNATMRQGTSVYNLRKLIVKEFELYGRSEARMRKVYGKSMNVVGRLTRAIHKRYRLHREAEDDAGRKFQMEPGSDADSQYGDREEEDEMDEKVPRVRNWKEAIQQWEKGDPLRGLTVPIRDWPADWRMKGRFKNSVYSRRKCIVEEFEFCGHDEDRMRELHGKNLDKPHLLVQSIRRRRKESGHYENLRRQYKNELVKRKQKKVERSEEEEEGEEEEDEEECQDDYEDEDEDGVKVEVKSEDDEEPLTRKRKSRAADDTQTSSKKNRPTRVQASRRAK